MQLFLAGPQDEQTLTLGEEEAHHCLRVLRHQPGDQLHCVDGRGTYYRAELVRADKRRVVLQILDRQAEWGEPAQACGLLFSPLKQRDRQEWLLEKAVELGVTHLWPIICSRTERTRLKPERSERILAAALKQCKRSRLPYLAAPQSLERALLALQAEDVPGLPARFVPWCAAAPAAHLAQQSTSFAHQACLFAIGPEGDFSDEEIQLLGAHGFRAVSLGFTRLRSETAALYCLTLAHACRAGVSS
jgi:16S rRNA (uracil1498-N3)-methyltransferase